MKRYLLLLLFVAPPAFTQGSLEVISLRHRTAEQVIPVLRPLLEPGGVDSASTFRERTASVWVKVEEQR